MRAVFALSKAELTMITRNRTAALNALLIPVGVGVVWVATSPPASAAAWGAMLLLAILAGSTVAMTATTTLVARRDQQVLERWRSSGAASSAILGGTLAPVCGLLVLQAAVMFGAIAYATGSAPAYPILAGAAVVLAGALAAALAFITAAFTQTVEGVSMAVLPAMAALLAGTVWVTTVEAGEVTWLMLATGGGAVAELVRVAWDGVPAGTGLVEAAGPAMGAVVVLTGIAAAVATRTFRWSPRT